ncbi:MAG: hypothetical protein KAI55_03680 [Candidatus Aenigmarchaeota archaeon]|nr:hypothetical protein [Candidatus Aenigmarchaeota archaeon]
MDLKSFFNIKGVLEELHQTKIMRWKLIYLVVKIFVILILLTFFISPKLATIFMFALIALVSAVPSVLANVLSDSEMMDFFSVIIAITIDPVVGAIFAAIVFFVSSFFSSLMEKPLCFLIGLPGLAIPCLFMPWAYVFFNGNLYYTLYFYTVLRYIVRLIPACIIVPDRMPIVLLFNVPINIVLAYITNTIHVALFGNLVIKALEEGLTIDMNLLVMITLIVFFFEVAKIYEAKMKKKKTPLDDKFSFISTIKSANKFHFLYPKNKLEKSIDAVKKDMRDYINIMLKKLKEKDYSKLGIYRNKLVYLRENIEQLNDFTKKENIEQLYKIASELPDLEINSFIEHKGIYDISNRHPEFEKIYENIDCTYKRPIEIIAKCRIKNKTMMNKKYSISNIFGLIEGKKQRSEEDRNFADIQIDVLRIIANKKGNDEKNKIVFEDIK